MKPGALLALSGLAAGGLVLLLPKKSGASPGGSSPVPAPPGTEPLPNAPPPVTSSGERVLSLQSPYIQGSDVAEVQQLLAGWGFDPGTIDGVFGPKTDAAVRSFQRVAGLDPDGVVGPLTYAALRSQPPPTEQEVYGPPQSPGAGAPAALPEPMPQPGQIDLPPAAPPLVSTPPFVPPTDVFTPPMIPGLPGVPLPSIPLPSLPGMPVPSTPPDSVLAAAANALATNDPKVIRSTAAALRAQGWPDVALGLEAAAKALETGVVTSLPPLPVVLPSRPPVAAPPTSSPPPVPASSGTRLLRAQTPMMQGADVIEVQRLLQAHGFSPGTVDGVYGPKSVAAVLAFQKARGLKPDGIVGPATLTALKARPPASSSVPAAAPPKPVAAASSTPPASARTLRAQTPMMQGADVLWVQNRLQALGLSPGTVDGVYGPKSVAAVLAFQKSRKLTADGIVGPNTYAALVASTGGVASVSGFGFDLTAPPWPQPSSPLPGVVPAMAPSAQHTPLQQAATRMVQNLIMNPGVGAESTKLVKAFQLLAPGLNPSGMYGPGTAEALIDLRTGLVPPTPRYWPRNARAADRAAYRARLEAQAALDPQRAEEWRQAASHVR